MHIFVKNKYIWLFESLKHDVMKHNMYVCDKYCAQTWSSDAVYQSISNSYANTPKDRQDNKLVYAIPEISKSLDWPFW